MEYSKDIFKKEKEYLLQTYKRIPMEISHGKGVYLFPKMVRNIWIFFQV